MRDVSDNAKQTRSFCASTKKLLMEVSMSEREREISICQFVNFTRCIFTRLANARPICTIGICKVNVRDCSKIHSPCLIKTVPTLRSVKHQCLNRVAHRRCIFNVPRSSGWNLIRAIKTGPICNRETHSNKIRPNL